jgi:hypothetical protein
MCESKGRLTGFLPRCKRRRNRRAKKSSKSSRMVGDPVGQGFVETLARPGGNTCPYRKPTL